MTSKVRGMVCAAHTTMTKRPFNDLQVPKQISTAARLHCTVSLRGLFKLPVDQSLPGWHSAVNFPSSHQTTQSSQMPKRPGKRMAAGLNYPKNCNVAEGGRWKAATTGSNPPADSARYHPHHHAFLSNSSMRLHAMPAVQRTPFLLNTLICPHKSSARCVTVSGNAMFAKLD